MPPDGTHIPVSSPNGDARLVRMRGEDGIHQVALHNLIEREAKAHDSEFTEAGFPKVLKSIQRGDVHVLFLRVGQEIVGGTVLFPSVDVQFKTTSGFVYPPAAYCEDMAVFEEFAGRGYGKRFLDDTIRYLNAGRNLVSPNAAIIGEHSKHAVPMIKMFDRLNATVGPEDETILVFNGPLKFPENRDENPIRVRIKLENLGFLVTSPDPRIRTRDNIFIASWPPSRGRRIVATFTRGISTFTGDPVVRVQFASNKIFPSSYHLAFILGGLLQAGAQEIVRRNWTEGRDPLPLMRINTIDEPDIRRIVKDMGAVDRKLGPHSTHPHAIRFKDISRSILDVNPNVPSLVLTDSGLPDSVKAMHRLDYKNQPAHRPSATSLLSRQVIETGTHTSPI